MNNKQFWPFLLVIPLVAAAAAGWFMLPNELVMQIGADGQPGNVMAKPLGLMIPVALGVMGAGIASSNTGKEQKLSGIFMIAVAAIVTILTFMWNL